MLIDSPRITAADRRVWSALWRLDAVGARSQALARLEAKALKSIEAFLGDGKAYAGVSWGKDSVVLAHLLQRFAGGVVLWSVRGEPLTPHECDSVRDEFLAEHHAIPYSEEVVWCRKDEVGWHATGTLEQGFAQVRRSSGTERYLSGVRSSESASRKRCMMRFGTATERTSRPLGHWTGADVFAYLRKYDLPTHPNYAMSMGGAIPRERLRVAWLTLRHGQGMGRREWELTYYRPQVEAIEQGLMPEW